MNAVEIHYVRTGGDKPTLIALHGLAGSGACWTALARTLEDEYDVVMPDARGHGRSSAPSDGYLYCDHASDVVGLIDALQLTDPILLGHSMGGMTAAVVASELGTALRGVVLVDPTFIGPEQQRDVYESEVVEQHRHLLRADKSELLTQSRLRHPHRSAEMIELLVDARLRTHIRAFEVLTPPNPPYHDLIRRIRAPLLMVLASKGVVSIEAARALQGLNPRLGYEVVSEVGHGLPYDRPEQLGAVVKAFARSQIVE
ncbi:alpha/beta fold hydrolase [Deinococcus yavapaiensis]|uniref:alpha/beta fold hydrolase n=1 Tax=Deinococcus yavapaiensis TaxID=309889 RepID=UPI001B874399|nr:alpha/beta hydrolase [Deinococcus yavapaiensis]